MIDYIKKHTMLLILILVAFVAYMITIFPSGSHYCTKGPCGLFFWGAHGHDAIWHLAIVSTAFKSFPFIAPTFAGAQLSGYNFFLDIIILFILFTGLLVKFARKLHDSPLFVGLLLFFMYFSGSFSYIITLIKNRTIWGSGELLAMQSLLSLTNVQFAFSLCVLLGILIIIKEKRTDVRSSTLLALLVGLNIALKFYGGVISIFLVSLYFLFLLLQKRDIVLFTKQLSLLSIFSIGAVLLFYNPFAPTTGGAIMTFKPFATVHQIIEDPNLFYLKDMVNARYFLEASPKFSPRLVWIEIQTLFIFILLNFGTRIIGILYIGKHVFKRTLTTNYQLLTTTIIFAMFLNIFFIQKGQWWNTVQFSYHAFFLMNIFTALTLYEIMKKFKKAGIVIVAIVILMSLPSSLDILRTFAQFPAHSFVSDDELYALRFLKKQPAGVVFTPLPNESNKQQATPVPLSAMADNAYITAFSGKQLYIGDEVQLQLTGVDYEALAKKSLDWNCDTILDVDYLYELYSRPIGNKLEKCKGNLKIIYENNQVRLYKANQARLLSH